MPRSRWRVSPAGWHGHQRQAQAQRDASRWAAAGATASPNEEFSQYIRGTQRMKDPYAPGR